MIVVLIAKLLLFLFFGVFVPGYALSRRLFLSVPIGLVTLTLVSYIEGWLHTGGYLTYVYVLGSLVILIWKKRYKDFASFKVRVNAFSLMIGALIVLGIVFQGVAMWRTGRLKDSGVGYFGPLARDGVWHEALTGQIVDSFPPQNPGFAGETLKNYHYFYDILVAKTHKVTGISIPTLIYRFYPIVFSALLGIGAYFLSWELFKNKSVSFFAVYFAYFGSSMGWIVELIKRGSPWGGESTFWANQPVSMNLNPPFAISLVIFISIILALKLFLDKPSFLRAFSLILLAGTVIGFKAYAGLIVLPALFVLGIKRILFNRDIKLLGISLASIILALLVYLPQADLTISLITLTPFWLVDSMIAINDRVGWVKLAQARLAYFSGNLWGRYVLAQGLGLFIFLVGNLGTRIVALGGIHKRLLKGDVSQFLLALAVTSLVFSLFLVQKGNPWNVVQFFYYFLFLAAIGAAAGIERIYKTLPKKTALFLVTVILVITPISSLATFRSWLYPNPVAVLSKGEYEGLKFLSRQERGTVLSHPFSQAIKKAFKDPYPLAVYADSTYVSAFSGQPSYLEDVEQQIILGTDYEPRLKYTERFFGETDLSWSKDFLKNQGISYLYVPKIFYLPAAEGQYPMTKIFENGDVNVYKIKDQ